MPSEIPIVVPSPGLRPRDPRDRVTRGAGRVPEQRGGRVEAQGQSGWRRSRNARSASGVAKPTPSAIAMLKSSRWATLPRERTPEEWDRDCQRDEPEPDQHLPRVSSPTAGSPRHAATSRTAGSRAGGARNGWRRPPNAHRAASCGPAPPDSPQPTTINRDPTTSIPARRSAASERHDTGRASAWRRGRGHTIPSSEKPSPSDVSLQPA